MKTAVPAILFFCTAAAIQAAAIDGTVMNATKGAPQSGATVSLFQVTNEGPKMVESVKSDAGGKFAFQKELQGPRLVQAAYGGVVYNRMIPPGMPSQGITLPVYESTKTPGKARVDQHMLLLEPSPNGTLNVSESYVFKNDGDVTWSDPDAGTLQFALPPEAQGKVEINATGPGSVPVRKAADPGPKPNTFKLDFPIKPGDSRVDLTWSMPFNSPGVFEDRNLYKGQGQTRVVAPKGVTLKGPDVTSLGVEPNSQATIYGVKGPVFKVAVEGTGMLRQDNADAGGQGDSGEDLGAPKLTENYPKIYGLISSTSGLLDSMSAVKWFVLSVVGMLACAFVLLYRKGNPNRTAQSTSTQTDPDALSKARHVRGRG